MTSSAPSPSWFRPAAIFAVVTVVIVGLAIWQPFAPSNSAAEADASGLVGDAAQGEALYAEGCAGCHGGGGEGGIGPALEGRALAETAVAGVIAGGRGTMPAAIFEGQEAQNVAAFVAQLSGGEAAQAAPVDPDPAPVAAAAEGDADSGETLFASTCAGCHGDAGAGGGSAPALNNSPRQAEAVASVIANGRGAMPAGLLTGTDAEDVAAYVARISGADDAAATPPAAAPDGEVAGRARLFGDNLWGLNVLLDDPAPSDWIVWVDGSGGLTRVGAIAAGAQELNELNVGPPPIIDAFDRVLVGADASSPALVGTITPDDAERFRRINNTDPTTPEAVSLLDGAAAQIAVFQEHTTFLSAAVAEDNPANLRFHSEHLVNIAEGEPLEELDGDGTPTNPGDGFGLVGETDADGYLSLLASESGGGIGEQAEALRDAIDATVEDARICATAQTIAEGADCSSSIAARGARIEAQWTEVREAVERSLSVDLVRPG